MALFEWKNGTKVQNAVVASDGTTVQDAVWEGETPLSANNMNQAQEKMQDEYKGLIGDLNNLNTTDKTSIVNAINEIGTDYIIESGSNANGYYEKYASGTLKQWGKALVTDEIKTANGSTGWYRTANEQFITHPVPFVGETPVVNLTPKAALQIAYISTNDLDKSGFYPLASSSAAGASRNVYWTAIGKWK